MRRILSAIGVYLAGLVTLPLLMWGVHFESPQTHTIRIDSPARVMPAVHQSQPIVASRVSAPSLRVHEFAKTNVAFVEESPVFEVAQADAKPAGDPFDPGEPSAPVIQRRDLGLDEPPAVPPIVLPVGSDTLAKDAAVDEAGLAKVKALRETLKNLIEEKSAKMSAEALQREIEMHQQHLADMNALEELLRLEQSLKELGDKFPNSDSGLKAKELLDALKHLRTPGGALHKIQQRLPGADLPKQRGASLPSVRPSPFAHGADFRWLRGIVDFDPVNQQWIMNYDQSNDPIALNNHSDLSRLRPGEIVLIEGFIDESKPDKQGRPVYQINKLMALKPRI